MIIQLTASGIALLQQGPFVLTSYTLGDGYNYVPNPNASTLQGTVVYTGTPGPAFPINGNVVRYSMMLDRSIGDFQFGELGLYVGTDLVAIGVSSSLIDKTHTVSGTDGNIVRIDAFLSMVGTTYEMWMNVGDTDNKYVVSSVDLVDYLPPVQDTIANAYIVGAPVSDMLAFFAYADRSGIWAFDQYKYSTTINHRYTVVEASTMQVTIADASLVDELDPTELGERILQFVTGADYSLCRNIQQALQDEQANTTVLAFNTPLAVVPAAGDQFVVYNRDPLASVTVNLPIGSADAPGIVQVGDGLDVNGNGLISVNRETVNGGLVYSITGKDESGNPVSYQGDVQLRIRDIVGGISSVNGQKPDAGGNVTINTGYTLPVASSTTLGGIRVSTGSGLTLDSQTGQLSVASSQQTYVQTVNGDSPDAGGNVQILGLIDPQDITAATNLNTLTYPGLYGFEQSAISGSTNLPTLTVPLERGSLEVVAMIPTNPQSAVMQRWTQSNATAWRFVQGSTFGQWYDPSVGGQIIATTTRLGSVIVGVGLSITSGGVISAKVATVAGVSADGSGNIPLTPADIQAIPQTEKNQQGGVPSLDSDPGGTGSVLGSYVYGRVALDRLALEALVFRGYWDANANLFSYVDDFGTVHNVSLEDGGKMLDTSNPSTTPVTTELPGLGTVLYTSTAGSTTIDTVQAWAIGDIVIGLNDRWIKVTSVPPVPVQDLTLGLSVPNAVAPSSVLFYQVTADPLTIDNTHNSLAVCRIAPSATVVFTISIDGIDVGTITFNSSTNGVIDFPTAAHMSSGSVLQITSPADVSTLYGLAVYLTFSME